MKQKIKEFLGIFVGISLVSLSVFGLYSLIPVVSLPAVIALSLIILLSLKFV